MQPVDRGGWILRRSLLTGLAALAVGAALRPAEAGRVTLRIDSTVAGTPISPYLYGSSDIGTMDGGASSASLDTLAGVTARRFGGNLTTSYNWVTNAANAGKDYLHVNGSFLADALGVPQSDRSRPGAVIERMHEASLAMKAVSFVTLPIAGYVAADMDGPVSEAESAPSKRFVPVRWTVKAGAKDPIDRSVADMPQLIARLKAKYGPAGSPRGIRGYILDNEPDLWAETHPRIVRQKITVKALIARSIEAAIAIKTVDPDALVLGPASWGATDMATLQSAPDWDEYRHYGSFLAAYLDAFRKASEAKGHRLLDVLDIHWYAYNRGGTIFRTEQAAMAEIQLEAPRTLSEPGFREASWVTDVIPVGGGADLALPILPSLKRLVAKWYPGTGVSVSEFNYGGAGQLASGLALVDALGRFGAEGVVFAGHWGSLDGWLTEAYRLFRLQDVTGAAFGDVALPVSGSSPSIRAYAARSAKAPGKLQMVVINAGTETVELDLGALQGDGLGLLDVWGFDAEHPKAVRLKETGSGVQPVLTLPGRSARRVVLG